jgi:V/A-type H+-transporting ATPase subunit K
MDGLLTISLLKTGAGCALLGAGAGLMLGCMGSARGIRIAAGQATGVLSEKPELFGKLLPLVAMPGTQGIYGLLWSIIVAMQIGVFATGPLTVTPLSGLALMAMGVALGGALWKSAVMQGETSAAAINMVARRPDQGGRAILMPALVETYALLALVAAILVAFMLTHSRQEPAAGSPATAPGTVAAVTVASPETGAPRLTAKAADAR